MNDRPQAGLLAEVGDLLRGSADDLAGWGGQWDARQARLCVAVIVVGAGLYRGSDGGLAVAAPGRVQVVKFPLLLLTTALGNALLNGMLAPLLGLNVRFRQSLMLVLMSFALASVILARSRR